jgi:hypothetical protein
MATGGSMGTGGAGGVGTGGSSGSGGSAMTDAQVAPDGHLDSGSDVAATQDGPAQCAFDRSTCQTCFSNVQGPCYAPWKNCINDPNMCEGYLRMADQCACKYQSEGSIPRALSCINTLGQYSSASKELSICITDRCSKECDLVP